MTQSNFVKMFGVIVYHNYFDNSKCNCLQFIPTNETEKILKKFGFKINNIGNGFDLFYNTTSSIDTILDYITKTTTQDHFEFKIQSNNPNFILFTALPIHWLGQIKFTSQLTKIIKNGNIELKETLETKEISPFLGQLKVYFKDIKKYQNNSKMLHFEINFNARETQWQYYIINRNTIPLNNLAIADKGNIQFDGPEKVILQTGEQALLFTSNDSDIQLSEKPKYKFDLLNKNISSEPNHNNRGKIIIKGLPVPDVSRIRIMEGNERHKVVSPMYIYL